MAGLVGRIVVGLAAALSPPALLLADDAQADIDRQVRAAIDRLDADEYQVRHAAELELASLGTFTLDEIRKSVPTASPEALARLLAVLERMFAGSEEPLADAAERTLDELARSEQPQVAEGARAALLRHHRLREERAVAAIERLGGKVEFSIDQTAYQMLQSVAPDKPIDDVPQQIEKIWLMDGWQGGEEGLWHLRRLSHVSGIDLYHIAGSGISADAVQQLAADLPNLRISSRGKATLGVAGGLLGECIISQVLRGGAADRAGIREMDVVTRVDDQPIAQFADLVKSLSTREPGERVTIQVRRTDPLSGQQTLTDIAVELHGWKEMQTIPRDPAEGVPAPPGQP